MLFAAGFAVWKRRAYEILPMMLLLGCWERFCWDRWFPCGMHCR
ncbi:MAG: hypothetical protein ACLR8P_06155 [Clostridium fessum]